MEHFRIAGLRNKHENSSSPALESLQKMSLWYLKGALRCQTLGDDCAALRTAHRSDILLSKLTEPLWKINTFYKEHFSNKQYTVRDTCQYGSCNNSRSTLNTWRSFLYSSCDGMESVSRLLAKGAFFTSQSKSKILVTLLVCGETRKVPAFLSKFERSPEWGLCGKLSFAWFWHFPTDKAASKSSSGSWAAVSTARTTFSKSTDWSLIRMWRRSTANMGRKIFC